MKPREYHVILTHKPDGTFIRNVIPTDFPSKEFFEWDAYRSRNRLPNDRVHSPSLGLYAGLGISAFAALIVVGAELYVNATEKLGDIKRARLFQTYQAEMKIAEQIDAEISGKLDPSQREEVKQIVNDFAISHHIDPTKGSFPESDLKGHTSDVVSQYIYEQTGGKLTRLEDARTSGDASILMVLPGGEGDPEPLQQLKETLAGVTVRYEGRGVSLLRI